MIQMQPEFAALLRMVLAMVSAWTKPEETTGIAGGCLRDHICGKPIKDIDVFIRTDRPTEEVLKDLRAGFPSARLEFNLEYTSNNDVGGVIDLGFAPCGYPVQVILMRQGGSFKDIVGRVDMGICQVGFSIEEGLYYSPAFVADIEQETMTVVNVDPAQGTTRSRRRYERLSLKYPRFTFVETLPHPPRGCPEEPCGFADTFTRNSYG